jgi:hypothetical protein
VKLLTGRWWFKMMLSSFDAKAATTNSRISMNLVPIRKMSTLQQTHRPLISKPLAHVGVPTSEAIPWPWTSSEQRAPWDSVAREIWSDPSSPSFQMFSGPSNRLWKWIKMVDLKVSGMTMDIACTQFQAQLRFFVMLSPKKNSENPIKSVYPIQIAPIL